MEFIALVLVALNLMGWGDELWTGLNQVAALYDRIGYLRLSTVVLTPGVPVIMLAAGVVFPIRFMAVGQAVKAIKLSLATLFCLFPYAALFVLAL